MSTEKPYTIQKLQTSIAPSTKVEEVVHHSIRPMPLYILAICLPLAFLLGFVMAIMYFKRSRQDQATQYAVTVEISEHTPDYEMKRMYSIIDINAANINKDFWAGLKSSDNSRSSILDLTSTKPTT